MSDDDKYVVDDEISIRVYIGYKSGNWIERSINIPKETPTRKIKCIARERVMGWHMLSSRFNKKTDIVFIHVIRR